MALQSVAVRPDPAESTSGRWVHSGYINTRDLLIEIALADGTVSKDTMRDYAAMTVRWAKSILTVARARGDNDEDAPGTMDDALAGAEFFLHLSAELQAAAPKMKGE